MDTIKLIKAINERMAVYERQDLRESAVYKDLQASLDILGIEKVEVKGGGFRISRSKANIAALSTQDGQEKLQAIERKGGLKQERAKVKAKLKKEGVKATQTAIKEQITNYGKLKEWAENNLDFLYEMVGTVDIAQELAEMFDSGIKNFGYDAVFDAIEIFEKVTAEWEENARQSDLLRAGETPIISGQYQQEDE